MRDFEILEKNDQYYVCTTKGSYCRIIIDENSTNLPLGKFSLHTENISDHYIHHTKCSVFRLILPYEKQDDINICTLATGRKNIFIYKRCLQLGGKWEPILNEWVFSEAIKDEVDKLGTIIHSEKIYIEATFSETITQTNTPLTLFGFPLIKSVRDNGKVTLNAGMKLMSGDLAHFSTGIEEKSIILANSRIRLYIPQLMLNEKSFSEDYRCVVKIEKKRKPKSKKVLPWLCV